MLEAALNGEGGRGEDNGGDLVEDELAEELGDVDGRGLEKGTAGTTAWARLLRRSCGWGNGDSALEPEDHVGGGGFEHEFEVGAEGGGAGLEAGGFVEIGEAVEIGFDER